jgi:hypothetical protein
MSSLSSRRQASKRRYSCNICGKEYAQPQGVTRHQREMHKARLCIYCREFRWGRLYLFREHLARQHPDVDPDAAVKVVKKDSRRTTSDQPRDPASTPTKEHIRVEFHLHPPTPPLPAMSNLPPVSPPAIPFVAYDPWFNFTVKEPTFTKRKRGNSHQIDNSLNSAWARTPFPFTEERS